MNRRLQGIDYLVAAARKHDVPGTPTYYGALLQRGSEIDACDHVHVQSRDATLCAIDLRSKWRAERDALVARTVTYTHDFGQPFERADARNGLSHVFATAWPSVDVLARDEHYSNAMRGHPYAMITRWRPATLRDVADREG